MPTEKPLMSDKSHHEAFGQSNHKSSDNQYHHHQQQQQKTSSLKKSSKRVSTTSENPSNFQDFSANFLRNKSLHELHFVRDAVSFQEADKSAESVQRSGTENLPLTITLAIGCGLLFVNLLIFGLVCFRKVFVLRKRNMNSRKMRQYKLDDAVGSNSSYPRNCGMAVDSCLDQSPAMSEVSTLNDQFSNHHHHLHHHHLRHNHQINNSVQTSCMPSSPSRPDRFKVSPGQQQQQQQGSPAYRRLESAFQICLKQPSRETQRTAEQNSDLVQLTSSNLLVDGRGTRTNEETNRETLSATFRTLGKQRQQQQQNLHKMETFTEHLPTSPANLSSTISSGRNYSKLSRPSKETDVTWRSSSSSLSSSSSSSSSS